MTTPSNQSFSQSSELVPPVPPQDTPPWLILIIFLSAAVALLALYGWSVASSAIILIELLVGAAALSAGSILGFLFGLPRTMIEKSAAREETATASSVSYSPSTNLEQISDWLTKILIGVGLVELRQIGEALASAGRVVAAALGENSPAGASVATQVVIVSFSVLGFIASFLWTRLYYGPMQFRFDRNIISEFREKLANLGQKVSAQVKTAQQSKSIAEQNKHILKEIASGNLVTQDHPLAAEKMRLSEKLSVEETWQPDVLDKIKRFRDSPRQWDRDPSARLFPGAPRSAKGRKLEAAIAENMDDALIISLSVVSESGEPFSGDVTFLLHPTLTRPVIYAPVKDNAAKISFYAEGRFTVVAIFDNGNTILAYDLADLPGAPEWFKNN